MNKICAIIPARGGSTRIHKKNIIDFAGKPLMCWAIQAAIDSGIFGSDIFVSTDDDEIAKIAFNAGAVPINRKTGNDDHTTVQQATIITLNQLKEDHGKEYDHVVLLMANCPLRDAGDIKEAWENFQSIGKPFQISCVEYRENLNWAMRMDRRGTVYPAFPRALRTRSQDMDKWYCPVGCIWIAKVNELLKMGCFYPDTDYTIFPMKYEHSIDIDTYEDFEYAKLMRAKT